MRTFDTGATRDTDVGKFDYDGFLSPLVLVRYAAYMHKHRTQSDGTLRDSANWQKGIPRDQYRKSAWRHFIEWWTLDRGGPLTPTGEVPYPQLWELARFTPNFASLMTVGENAWNNSKTVFVGRWGITPWEPNASEGLSMYASSML